MTGSGPVWLEVLVEEPSAEVVLRHLLPRIARDSHLPAQAVLFRIVIEELEAWFLGDVPALCRAYPRLPTSLGQQDGYRDPDAIRGTWEALERVLRKHGYHRKGLAKYVAAGDVAPHMDVDNNRSRSFQVFRDGLRRLVKEGGRGAQA